MRAGGIAFDTAPGGVYYNGICPLSRPRSESCVDSATNHPKCLALAAAKERFEMKITGTHWAVHYREGKTTFGDSRIETDNLNIANTLLAGVEASGETLVPFAVQREIHDLNRDLTDSPWKIEPILADAPDDIPIGSHLITSRGIYTHHGIYVGNQKVIHYAGLANGLNAGPVEEVNLVDFSHGNGYSLKTHPNAKFNGEQATGRARSRIGEKFYCVASNNCEHFCEWCINGDHHSDQVDLGTAGASLVVGTVAGLAARGVVAGSGTVVGVSSAGIMSGLASVGGLVGGGAVAGVAILGGVQGVAMASLVNNTVMKDNPKLGTNDRDSRAIGRVASYVGAGAGTAGGIGAISAFGSIAGLSATGISSGLASIGAVVGGGMVGGVVVVTAAPVVLAAVSGFGLYKLAKYAKGSDPEAIGHCESPPEYPAKPISLDSPEQAKGERVRLGIPEEISE